MKKLLEIGKSKIIVNETFFLRLIRLGLLQDVTQKRLKFILNIAIFLSIFAIVSTLISISIERKINLKQKKFQKIIY